MKIIKRNGSEEVFYASKIATAVTKANNEVDPIYQLNPYQIEAIATAVTKECEKTGYAVNVEQIQDMVEKSIMEQRGYEVAQKYVRYRFTRELARKANTTDDAILTLIDGKNEEIKQENSNKNPTVNSVQRDYMAGEVSKDIMRRTILPEDLVKANEEGMIHVHDQDYISMREHNCDLINLQDMLENGTNISGTAIEKPKSFRTACNIATQIVAQVSSNQFGGQSFSLTHLAPFVDVSRKKIKKEVIKEAEMLGSNINDEKINAVVNARLLSEIKDSIQLIQYQLLTLMTCNGQTPFITIFMYLNEAKDPQTKKDLALIIEEMLKQRIQGIKNEQGVYITPAFPKLIYVLQEDNIKEGSEYFYLTELAAKCTAKRMVPDYISEKKMKELKEGNCFPSMGCRSFLSPWKDENGEYKFYGRLTIACWGDVKRCERKKKRCEK